MAVRRQISRWLLVCLVAIGADAAAQTDAGVPTAEDIVARMGQARAENRASFRPYVVTRDYKLFGKNRNSSKSQVVAEVTFVPPTSKKYAIQRTQGAGLGEKIVRRMLEGEVEITVAGKPHRLTQGELILMPAGQPHALKAIQRFKMILTMLRS